jgi:integrase
MVDKPKKFSHKFAENVSEPGKYSVGKGLFLQVNPAGKKSWLYRYRSPTRGQRPRDMGLGPFPQISLAMAEERAFKAARLRLQGIDPIDDRRAKKKAEDLAAERRRTFKQVCEDFLQTHEASWKNEKHRQQWKSTLEQHAYPAMGETMISDIDASLVAKVLRPIWSEKTETAARLRGRIKAVLDYAISSGLRDGDNPADISKRGRLAPLLPKRELVQKREHHPALAYEKVGAFMADLREQDLIAARALEVLILTAARTSEIIGARWDEIDLDAKVWTVPANRIKARKEHRVPLSSAAISVMERMKEIRDPSQPWIFQGPRKKGLSNGAFLALLKRMKRSDITAHGFRSTFRDWCAEQTAYPREVAEMALAHAISNKVEAAYRRGDLFEKRRRLMEDWATYCGKIEPSRGGNVVTLAG